MQELDLCRKALRIFHRLEARALTKDQSRISGDAFLGTISICHIGWNSQYSLATNLHANNTLVPTLDHFPFAKMENELELMSADQRYERFWRHTGLPLIFLSNSFPLVSFPIYLILTVSPFFARGPVPVLWSWTMIPPVMVFLETLSVLDSDFELSFCCCSTLSPECFCFFFSFFDALSWAGISAGTALPPSAFNFFLPGLLGLSSESRGRLVGFSTSSFTSSKRLWKFWFREMLNANFQGNGLTPHHFPDSQVHLGASLRQSLLHVSHKRPHQSRVRSQWTGPRGYVDLEDVSRGRATEVETLLTQIVASKVNGTANGVKKGIKIEKTVAHFFPVTCNV